MSNENEPIDLQKFKWNKLSYADKVAYNLNTHGVRIAKVEEHLSQLISIVSDQQKTINQFMIISVISLFFSMFAIIYFILKW